MPPATPVRTPLPAQASDHGVVRDAGHGALQPGRVISGRVVILGGVLSHSPVTLVTDVAVLPHASVAVKV